MPMEHNVFISYAWVDNEVYPGADKGWVSTFVDCLRKHLAHELGRREEAERIWLDYEQMRGNDSVTPTIRATLQASRTLVLVLSTGYLASAWCQQELAVFLEKVGEGSDRIFVVQMSPVEQEPEALADLVKYRFWYLDDRRRPSTRWFPHIDPTDREYSFEQQRLARDLADKLRELLAAGDRDAVPLSDGPTRVALATGKTRAVATPTPAPVGDHFVLVSGGENDRDLIYQTARRLEENELGVAIPLSAMADQAGIKSSVLSRDLRTKLSLCDSVLIVYRSGPLDQVSQYLIECLKAGTRARKGHAAPSIDLCQTQEDHLALGLHPVGMRIHVVGKTSADDCVKQFLAR